MKRMRRIFKLLRLSLLMTSMIFLQSCLEDLDIPEIIVSGDWRYRILDVDGVEMAGIQGLSEEGSNKNVLVMPEYLDGYKVYGLYDKLWSSQFGRIHNRELKLYINFEFKNNYNKISVDKVLTMNPSYIFDGEVGTIYFNTYIPLKYDINSIDVDSISVVCNCNVTYYSNYGDNDIYWIDDYENEELITYIPEEPKREGYTFDGWYKESECINKWDFDIDKVPGKNYYKDIDYFTDVEYNTYKFYQMSNYDYMETKLYAKWIEE